MIQPRLLVAIVLPALLVACGDGGDKKVAPTFVQFGSPTYTFVENVGTASIEVTRSGNLGQAITVDYFTLDVTAIAGSDFLAASGTLSWPKGDGAPKSILVALTGDFDVEGDETFQVTLWNPKKAKLGTPISADVTIQNDDQYGTLQFSLGSLDIDENAGTATLPVSRVGGVGDAVGVTYSTFNGTAMAGVDFTSTAGSLTWTAGDGTDKSIVVPIANDLQAEGDETFQVSLTVPTGGATIGTPSSVTVTILDDERLIEVGSPTYQVAETGLQVIVTLTRSGGLSTAASVDFATSNGTATAGSDYQAASGTMNWIAGDGGNKTFAIDVTDDGLLEGEETVNITLSNPTGATIGAQGSAVLTILDDEVALQFASATYTSPEGTPSVAVTVDRLGGASGAVGVAYATSEGTARDGSDYTGVSGSLLWPAWDSTSKTIWIDILDESVIEGNETFDVILSAPVGAALGTPSVAVVTVQNDDATVQLSAAAYQELEATGIATITVTRTGATDWPVDVDYATADGTAVAGSDYVAASGTLSWPGGDVTNRTFDVIITDDAFGEPDETIDLALSNPTGGATLGTPSAATLTVLNDDISIQLTSATYQVGENGFSVDIYASRVGPTAGLVGIDFATSDGTAIAPGDYVTAAGSLSWPDGDGTDKFFTVDIVDDVDAEGPETVNLALSNPTGGATLGVIPTAVLTINDDETTVQFTSATFQVDEGAGTATITVSRAGGSSGDITVDWATSDGTAVAPGDYTPATGTLTWLSGDMSNKSFTVDIIDDPDKEGNEDLNLALSSPFGCFLGTQDTTVLTIVDNEIFISGNVTYDRIPVTTSGLDYNGTYPSPCREVLLEAVRSSDQAVLDTTSTDAAGDYTVQVPTNTTIYLRVLARLEQTGPPTWDVRVVDNTNGQALYSSVTADFDSGPVDVTNNDIHFDSGWGGSSYTSTRHAAPFAILDTAYTIVQKIAAVDPNVDFPLMLFNWSINNINVSGDKTQGEIGGSHYDPSDGGVYLLGEEDDDTEEYDIAVIAHEWVHYFQDQLSRSDSMGGPHSLGDHLDMCVAYGEGLATGLGAALMDEIDYVDTGGAGQGSTLVTQDVEDNSEQESHEGWFSETSVQVLIYDLYDSADDGADTISLGFGPIYDVLVNDEPFAESYVTIYSFIHYLKQNNPGDVAAINALVADEDISSTFVDPLDSSITETNDGGEAVALPVYTEVTVGAPPVSLCSNGSQGNYNKLANRSYFFFTITTTGNYTIEAVPDGNGNPVLIVYLQGVQVGGVNDGGGGVTESMILNLDPGTYVGEVWHWNHVMGGASGEECFDVSVN